MFFCPLSIAIISLWEERANLSALRTFFFFFFFLLLLLLICACLVLSVPLPLGVWEALRFVTVAHPGRFSCLFLVIITRKKVSILLCSDHCCDLRTIVLIVLEYPNDHNEKKKNMSVYVLWFNI